MSEMFQTFLKLSPFAHTIWYMLSTCSIAREEDRNLNFTKYQIYQFINHHGEKGCLYVFLNQWHVLGMSNGCQYLFKKHALQYTWCLWLLQTLGIYLRLLYKLHIYKSYYGSQFRAIGVTTVDIVLVVPTVQYRVVW